MMTVPEWREFLQRWSDEWLSTQESFPRQVQKRRWLGFPPATEKQISQLEKRLNYPLPPSYRNFLLTTNGWSRASYLIERIRPASKVVWLETEDPELVEIWASEEFGGMKDIPPEDYYTYDGPSVAYFDPEHFRKLLLIADPIAGDSLIYLLNPLAVAEDGEWEAWRFANWIPGVERCPSFELLMQEEHARFLESHLGQPATGVVSGPYGGPYGPDRPRHAATPIGRPRKKSRRPTIPELIAELESPHRANRLAAANQLSREVGPHEPDADHPEIVAPLSRILRSQSELEVRAAAAGVFGTYGNASAIPPLIDALDAAELTSSVLGALFYLSVDLHDSRIGDAMVRLLERPQDDFVIVKAIEILENLKDARVAPVSLRLLDQAAEMPLLTSQTSDTAGITSVDLADGSDRQRLMFCFDCAFAFVRSSTNATDELVRRLTHANALVRAAVTAALREDPHRGPHLAQYLTPLLDDVEPAVRQQAAMTLRFLEPPPKVEITPQILAKAEEAYAELQRRTERDAARRKKRF